MFQLETTNIRFEHLAICSKGCWGKRSSKVIQSQNKIIALPHVLLNYSKNLKHVTLAYNQGKSSDHIIFYISGFHGYLILA